MIRDTIQKLLDELPQGVRLEAAAKTRSPEEVAEAIDAGVHIIGENYIQEAEAVQHVVRGKVPMHFIGHLQRNKAKKAVELFDLIETMDSLRLAQEIDNRAGQAGTTMDVLIEINSGRESQKFGVFPEDAKSLIEQIAELENIRICGLMTMGPYTGAPEEARPYFVETRKCFEDFADLSLPNVEMKYLSMGMTNSYKVAIEEGANIVRLGTALFGERHYG
jgi:pyridoxal phosphate enzyme (YggS family)